MSIHALGGILIGAVLALATDLAFGNDDARGYRNRGADETPKEVSLDLRTMPWDAPRPEERAATVTPEVPPGTWYINQGGFTHHGNRAGCGGGRTCNNFNPGFIIEYHHDHTLAFGVGVYHSSQAKSNSPTDRPVAVYATRWTPLYHETEQWGVLKAGITFAAFWGYHPRSFIIAPLPTLAWEGKKGGVQLLYAPKDDSVKPSTDAIILQFKHAWEPLK